MTLSRRTFLGAAVASSVGTLTFTVPGALPALGASRGPDDLRRLKLFRYHGGKRLTADYYKNGTYQDDVLRKINTLCQDQLRKEAINMDPTLIDYVHEVCRALNPNATVQIISAYRTPKTNAILRGKSKNVAKKSLHMQGRAIDIRIPPYAVEELAEVAQSLRMGGVGVYRRSGFVHLDTGRPRLWIR